jgi:hypothetical protein
MEALHQAYRAVTEDWWLLTLAVSCLVGLLVAPKAVPMVIAVAALVLGALLTMGWMLLDLAYYPGTHNLLPLEAIFKLVLLAPLVASLWYKFR